MNESTERDLEVIEDLGNQVEDLICELGGAVADAKDIRMQSRRDAAMAISPFCQDLIKQAVVTLEQAVHQLGIAKDRLIEERERLEDQGDDDE